MASYEKIINWLVAQRNLAGKTQKQLSDELGKTQSFVSKYETFQKNLDLSEFIEICRALKCDPSDVVRSTIINGNS